MSARSNSPPVIVSVTPLALGADSRTFKQANSVARLGYRSIVVEGVRSRFDPGTVPFEVISLTDPAVPSEAATREKVKRLQLYRNQVERQIAVAVKAINENLQCCEYLKSDVESTASAIDDDVRVAGSQGQIAEFRVALQNFLWEIKDTRADRHASNNCPENADALIDFYDAWLRKTYRTLDEFSAQRAILLAQTGELVHDARERTLRDEKRRKLEAFREQFHVQLSLAVLTVQQYRRRCDYLETDLTLLLLNNTTADRARALLSRVGHFRSQLSKFEAKAELPPCEPARGAEAAESLNSEQQIDDAIGLYSFRLQQIYREGDHLSEVSDQLVEEARELSQRGARQHRGSAGRAAARVRRAFGTLRHFIGAGMRRKAAFANELERLLRSLAPAVPTPDRALRIVCRGWRIAKSSAATMVKTVRAWQRRCLTQWSGSRYGIFVLHLRAFLRHLLNYANIHVWTPLRLSPPASLYYLHSFYQFPAIYLLCLRYRAKFIYDAHDFYSDMHDPKTLSDFWRRWVLPMEGMIERACIRKAAAIVTVNEGIADLIAQRYGRTAAVLRNSHDSRLEQPVERTIREVLGLKEDRFLVVCVGQFKQGMAVEAAIDAVALLPNRFHVAFLGAGFPQYSDRLAEAGVFGRVHFLQPVAPSQVVPFIRSADAGMVLYYPVSASIERCLPNGFFQPVAAGLPMLCPNLPEIQRVADRFGIALPIDPQDASSIAGSLQRLAADCSLLAALRNNIASAKAELSWERDEQRLSQLIENLIGGTVAQSLVAAIHAES